MRRVPRLVTLSTDLGSTYAAQMKGVLYRSLPPGHVIDLTHDLPRHQIAEAAFLVRQIGHAFPPGSVHVVIVDPGVGGDRAPIAVQGREGSYLVGPDNGVLSPWAAQLGVARVVRLEPKQLRGAPAVGRTFEGRDLFAPAAARLALGSPLLSLGRPWKMRTLALPEPATVGESVRGTIVHIDHFGNAITNVPSAWLPETGGSVKLTVARQRSRTAPVRGVYDELPPNRLGLLPSSFGTVELALRERSAAAACGLKVGQAVALRPIRSPSQPARR